MTCYCLTQSISHHFNKQKLFVCLSVCLSTDTNLLSVYPLRSGTPPLCTCTPPWHWSPWTTWCDAAPQKVPGNSSSMRTLTKKSQSGLKKFHIWIWLSRMRSFWKIQIIKAPLTWGFWFFFVFFKIRGGFMGKKNKHPLEQQHPGFFSRQSSLPQLWSRFI